MPRTDVVAPDPDAPASASETRSAYLDQSVVAYLLYGVGAVTAFLAVALSLSDTAAALHSSLLAVGLLSAGLIGYTALWFGLFGALAVWLRRGWLPGEREGYILLWFWPLISGAIAELARFPVGVAGSLLLFALAARRCRVMGPEAS